MMNFLSVEILVSPSVMCGPGWFSDLDDGVLYAWRAWYHALVGALVVVVSFPSYGDGWSSLVLQMLEDALGPVAIEWSFTFVRSLVGDGIFMWLEILTSLGFKWSLVEMLFMLLFDMLSWWLLCHGFLFITSLELWHDTIIWYDHMEHVISLEDMV